MSLHVKKGDNVLVLAGKDKGKTGKVLSVNPDKATVVVDGVNVVTKHNKPRSAQVPGGIEKVNGNIDISNVMVICPICGKATRIAAGEESGKKVRLCKKCGAGLDVKVAKKPAKKSAKASAEGDAAPAEKKTVKKTKKTAEKSTEKKTSTAKKSTKKATEAEEK